MPLTLEQQDLLNNSIQSKLFLRGPAGTGKTTAGVHWLKKLIKSGIPAHQILVFTPQRILAKPYLEHSREEVDFSDHLINTMTLGSLARRMVDLFWPLISQQAGVAEPNLPPHFLTLETAQYYMAHLVRPLIDNEGFFQTLTINRNRIYSQILDNLNKAAIVGFPYQEIGDRLKAAWVGDIEQLHIYDDVQNCVNRFRQFCLDNNLLDFSLQVEIFTTHLWHSQICRDHLNQSFRHIIVDNIEEDTPVSHDILQAWLPEFESALFIFDEDAGYRFFLGADVQSALSLQNNFTNVINFEQNLINTEGVAGLKYGIKNAIARLRGEPEIHPKPSIEVIESGISAPEKNPKYFPAMVQWVIEKIARLIERGVPPGEIVVLAPFMPDVLRFALSNQLDDLNIPNQAHRPSRSLRDEPATQTLLTMATVAFPTWELLPKKINLSFALMQSIEGLDLVRAQLLTDCIYQEESDNFTLLPFEKVPADVRDRITYRVGERYDRLRSWLIDTHQQDSPNLDFFLNRLFGEVLSQPGFHFHNDLNSGNTIANLIESIQKFRWAISNQLASESFEIGKEYIQMVRDGVIAAQYMAAWEHQSNDAVFLSPAYTFLISNRPVDFQFWLDIGSPSWYQRMDQPLTQPYVLNRRWEKGDVWNTEDEVDAAHQTLNRLTIGLLNRCRKKIYLGMSELDIRGYENRGLLVRIIQHVLQTSQGKPQ